MLTRLKLRIGEGELVEANPKIGRVYSPRRMTEEAPLGSESQFMDNFMAMRAMVEEMYLEFKKGQGESTSTLKPEKGVEEPFLVAPPEGKGKGEIPSSPCPPSSPSSSSSSSSLKTSPDKKKEKFLDKIRLEV